MAVKMVPKQENVALLRLKRVSDLFVEGTEVVLQDDPLVMVWVNKLNTFEDDEARKDGLAFRSMSQLKIERAGDFHPAVAGYIAEFEQEDQVGRAEKTAQLFSQEDLVAAMNEVDGQEEWQEKGNMIRRGQMIAESDDVEEQKEIAAETVKYFEAIQKELESRTAERANEFKLLSEQELAKQFRRKVIEVVTLDDFVRERDISMIYFSLRNCESTEKGNHSECKHERLLEEREQVASLPSELVRKVKEALDSIEVNPREAGFLAAPTPSSESSEQPSEAEESPVSIPTVMSTVSLPAS